MTTEAAGGVTMAMASIVSAPSWSSVPGESLDPDDKRIVGHQGKRRNGEPQDQGRERRSRAGPHPADPTATSSAAADPFPPGPGTAARTRPTASKVPSRPIKGARAAIRLSVPTLRAAGVPPRPGA